MATTKRKRPALPTSHTGLRKPVPKSKSSARPHKKGAASTIPPRKKPRTPPAPKKSQRRIEPPPFATSARRENKGKRPEIRSEPSEEAKTMALVIAMAALDKKAVDVQIFDVVGRVDYADYLVLMSGRSDRHVVSIADGVEEALRKGVEAVGDRPAIPSRKPTAVEGRAQGNWVVLDFDDVVAHVFQEEARSFYDLDSLWQDARRIPVSEK